VHIDNGPKTLAALFADSVFNVPPFQRAYAWEQEPHLRNFIEDLRSHPAGDGKIYFLGTILLTVDKMYGSQLLSGYAVVDGQQRLTTTFIFVAVALARLRADPNFAGLADAYYARFIRDSLGTRKFHTVSDDDGFFDHIIVAQLTAAPTHLDTPSQRRLLDARNYFAATLSAWSTAQVAELLGVLYASQVLGRVDRFNQHQPARKTDDG